MNASYRNPNSPVEFKPHELTSGQWPTQPTNDWLISSPSLRRWGRRILFYDIICSLGPYQRLKGFTMLLVYALWVCNGQLHHRAQQAPASSSDAPQARTALHFMIRQYAFWVLILSFFIEFFSEIPRMRLVE